VCRQLIDSSGVSFAGLHVYDGHIHDADVSTRGQNFETAQHAVEPFLDQLAAAGIAIPLIVGGGSPTFPWHARKASGVAYRYECSPGTTLLWDAGYGTNHPDLEFQVAAVLMCRVLSKPGEGRLCLELGHKAVAGENPIENRVRLPELPDAVPVGQSEEHLVLETPEAAALSVGDVVYGIPWHICPTVALHQEAVVIRGGRATGERWRVRARDRRITI
jgi:D-serine deaminase-like pyridoxal phosphate-dependent protein